MNPGDGLSLLIARLKGSPHERVANHAHAADFNSKEVYLFKPFKLELTQKALD